MVTETSIVKVKISKEWIMGKVKLEEGLSVEAGARTSPTKPAALHDQTYVITGARLRCLIRNAQGLLRFKYRKSPLWSLVSALTGHGSGESINLCKSINLDPHQECGVKFLKPAN